MERKKKRNPNWKEEEVIFADSMILYIGNPNDAIRKLLGLINEFSKVVGYKINTWKFLAFLYINNGRSEKILSKQSHLPLQEKE